MIFAFYLGIHGQVIGSDPQSVAAVCHLHNDAYLAGYLTNLFRLWENNLRGIESIDFALMDGALQRGNCQAFTNLRLSG
ncbi:MAG: hypothetical protein JZU65_24840, partial [Chlorobium sp.]|nr:hypothetical protein [Chlorobium sp.]